MVTAEYSKANLGGDAADIKLNGEAGVYDVYFNYDKLELKLHRQTLLTESSGCSHGTAWVCLFLR